MLILPKDLQFWPRWSMSPTNPRYQGFIGVICSPLIFFRRFATTSRGLWFGTEVLQPDPMPSHPLTRIIGMTGA